MNPTSWNVNWQVLFKGSIVGGSGATWWDDDPEIRPETTYQGNARTSNVAGWSNWGANCSPRTKYPPVPSAPSIWASNAVASQTITWGWSRPANANYFQLAPGRYSGGGTSVTSNGNPWDVQQCARVRAAYSSRLASWGYTSGYSGNACKTPTYPIPAAPGGAVGNKLWWNSAAGYVGSDRTQIQTAPTASGFATGYNGRYQRMNAVTHVASSGALLWFGGCFSSSVQDHSTSVQVSFQAYNPHGSSSWGPWISISQGMGH